MDENHHNTDEIDPSESYSEEKSEKEPIFENDSEEAGYINEQEEKENDENTPRKQQQPVGLLPEHYDSLVKQEVEVLQSVLEEV